MERYMVYRIRFRIHFYKYPRSKPRRTPSFPPTLYISLLSQEFAFPEFLFPSLDRPSPSSFFLYFFDSATRLFHETHAPRGREFVRDSRRDSPKTFVEIRGRYTIKFPEAKNTNRAPRSGPIIPFRASN